MYHSITGIIIKLTAINAEPIINNSHEVLPPLVNRVVICGAVRILPNGAIAPASNFSKKSRFSRIPPTGSFPIFSCGSIFLDGGVDIDIVFQIMVLWLSR